MDFTKIEPGSALVAVSRTELVALRYLLEYAPNIPFELRGPTEIFSKMLAEVQPVLEEMGRP